MTNSNRNWLIVAIVFVAAFGIVLRLESSEEAKKAAFQKWEYAVSSDEKDFARLGEQGYELVDVTPASSTWQVRYYFKRPKQ